MDSRGRGGRSHESTTAPERVRTSPRGVNSARLHATGAGSALETTLKNFGVDVGKERLRLSIPGGGKKEEAEGTHDVGDARDGWSRMLNVYPSIFFLLSVCSAATESFLFTFFECGHETSGEIFL